MKNIVHILLLAATLAFSGCGVLMPKNVELFQDKVRAVPEAKESERETQRQAAALAAIRAQDTLVAAVAECSSTNVTTPAEDTAVLTKAVSLSVGPPLRPSSATAPDLAQKLETSVAALNRRLDDFKKENNENAGKKIEGTGLFQVRYFTMWAGIMAFGAVVWFALKVYGMVNPIVGLGTNVFGRVSSTLLKRGVTELSEGGEWFKEYLKEEKSDLLSKSEVLELFRRAHVEAQSRDVQTLIEKLTEK
jgi:hypothetical protein